VKLLFVATVASTIDAFLLPHASYFRARGWRVDAAASDATSSRRCAASFDRVFDIGWARSPLSARNMKAAGDLRRLVEREGYDLVHVHTPVAGFVTRIALAGVRRARGTKVVYTAHGFHFYEGAPALRNAAFLALEKLGGRHTDSLVVINEEDRRQALRHCLVPAERVTLMPGIGVPIDEYRPESVGERRVAEMAGRLGHASNGPVFAMVAEFIPRKRHLDAVEALALLALGAKARAAQPAASLVFAGDGPLRGRIAARAAELGLRERVVFLGLCHDVPALLGLSAALVLPSSQEGLPRSIMEALCAGVPALVSDIRGNRDLVSDGDGGLTFKVGDRAMLAARMRHILEHPEEARAMGRAGRDRMRDYDVAHVIRLHEELYESLAGKM